MYQPLNAKDDPPKYNFSIETLNDFSPGKEVTGLNGKYGKAEDLSGKRGVRTLKFNVAQIRYKFPILVQEQDGFILDSFARLPSYFLHDIFLQSLVNKFGKQTSYKKVGEEAVYIWEKEDLKLIYSASCTITCFPIFYAAQPQKAKTLPLLEQMKKASQGN